MGYGAVKVIFEWSFGVLATVFIVALSPLHFYHMTPTGYPFYLSPQLILGFACLIILHRLPAGNRLHPGRIMAYLVLYLVLLSSEYTLLFIGGIAVYDAAIVSYRGKARLRTLMTGGRGWTVTFAFLSHILFQNFIGTGQYTATSGQGQLATILNVQIWHSLNGLTLGPAALSSLSSKTLPATVFEVFSVLTIGVTTFATAFLTLKRVRLSLPDLAVLIGLCLFGILCLTLPIAMLQKYRDWCVTPDQCAYLDSRYAGWALAAMLSGVAAATSARRVSRVCWSVGLGLLAVLGALQNNHVSKRMVEARTPWRIAQVELCGGTLTWDRFLASQAAADIPFHVGENRTRQDYWTTWAEVQDCSR